jgi:hypothetical protein
MGKSKARLEPGLWIPYFYYREFGEILRHLFLALAIEDRRVEQQSDEEAGGGENVSDARLPPRRHFEEDHNESWRSFESLASLFGTPDVPSNPTGAGLDTLHRRY